MDQLGHHNPTGLNTARRYLPGGAGTQTAGLAFGGVDGVPPTPGIQQQKNMMDQLGLASGSSLATGRYQFIRCRYTTAALGFGGADTC
jgi:hypothetical protein